MSALLVTYIVRKIKLEWRFESITRSLTMSRWVMKQAERTGVEPVSDIEFTSAPYLEVCLATFCYTLKWLWGERMGENIKVCLATFCYTLKWLWGAREDGWESERTYLTRTSTTLYLPATLAHHSGVTLWTDLQKSVRCNWKAKMSGWCKNVKGKITFEFLERSADMQCSQVARL